MTINAILHVAILAISAGVETCQKGNGIDLVFCRLVLMLKAATVSLRAGAAQIVIVAQFVTILALLDAIQRGLGHLNGRIQSSGSGVPLNGRRRRLGRLLSGRWTRRGDRSGLDGQRNLGRRTGVANSSRVGRSRGSRGR